MNVSELLPFLESIGASPKKGLSQNFLIDGNIVRKIVGLADIQPGDSVLEIGPGPGALTRELLDAGATVFAIEKDTKLAHALPPHPRLTVFNADALTFPLSDIPPTKVVANLPYNITTPLLERLFEHRFSSLTLMVQKEFCQRLLGKPGTKEYSSLTIFAQVYTQLAGSFFVSSSCFFPRPKVDSAVIRLDAKPLPDLPLAPFFAFVRKAFQQRRKMIRTSLSEFPIAEGLKALHIREDARPEALSLAEWLELFKKVSVSD